MIHTFDPQTSASTLKIGGVFDASISRHYLVQRALEEQDPEKLEWTRKLVCSKGWNHDREGYVEVERDRTHNIIPTGGLNFLLNLLFHSTAKIPTWYHGPFTSNWTPMATAGSNWAGSTSGPVATELQASQFAQTNRQPANFQTAAANGQIVASAATQVEIAEGVENVTVYGTTLNSSPAVNYNATDAVLLAATRFTNPKSGLGASDVLNLSYTLTVSSV